MSGFTTVVLTKWFVTKLKIAAAAAFGTVLAFATGASAQGDETQGASSQELPWIQSDTVVPVESSKCTGGATLPGNGPFCYRAKIGMLGVTETLDLTVTRTAGEFTMVEGKPDNLVAEKGSMDLIGSGISPFECKGVHITKNGQEVSPDMDALKHCLPRGVSFEKAQYCSDTNQVQVSIKDSNIPFIGTITKTAQAVECPKIEEATRPATGLEGVGCKVCTFILTKVEAMLPVDAGKQKIENILDKVCAKLPGFLDQPCENFVNKEADAIVDGLMNKLTPEAICAKVHAC
jgi:hypothetical protein